MYLFKIGLLFFVTIVENVATSCYSKDDNPYLYFTTSTPYEVIRGSGGSETTCKPLQIWSINRHGSRNPVELEMNFLERSVNIHSDLIENESVGYLSMFSDLCPEDLNLLKSWTLRRRRFGSLTKRGREELYLLAKRWQNRYPELLQGPYTPDDYYFRHTNSERTNDSCRAFIDGLFGNGTNAIVKIVTEENDMVIAPFLNCQYWTDSIFDGTNNNTVEQSIRNPEFTNVAYINEIILNNEDWLFMMSVSRKLGYSRMITPEDLISIYLNCRFGKKDGINEISPWCTVFTKRQLLLLEYIDDLDRYYKFGHGNWVNKKMGRMPLKHLLETFDRTIDNDGVVDGYKLVAMFTHDLMFDMLYTALDYGKEQSNLTGTDYENFLVIRKYRTSLNIPFAANMVAILHDCGMDDKERFKVQFFVNERQMELSGCQRGLCDWSFLKQHYSDYDSWNTDFCDNT